MHERIAAWVILSMTACAPRLPSADTDTGTTETETSGTPTSTTSTTTETETGAPIEDSPDSCGTSFDIGPGEPVPRQLMLVVDTSASMLDSWDHDGDPMTPTLTRWAAARGLIEQLLPMLADHFAVGLQRYPSAAACPNGLCSDADVCLVADAPELAPEFFNGPAILDALPPGDATLHGGSPVRLAYASAHAQLLEPADQLRQIILITDGAGNCSDGATLPDAYQQYDDALLPLVQQAFNDDGIYTLVVGVGVSDSELAPGDDRPQVNAFTALNELALTGGAPFDSGQHPQKFYGPDQLDALLAGLEPLFETPTCEIDLNATVVGPPEPTQIPFVELSMDGQVLPYLDESCAGSDGWTWIDYGRILTLCGEPCDQFKYGDAGLHIEYGCEAP